jgi:hypothetical protein
MWFGFTQPKQKGDMTLPPGSPGYLEPQEGPMKRKSQISHPGSCESAHPGQTHDQWLASVTKDEVSAMIHTGDAADPANNDPPNKPW